MTLISAVFQGEDGSLGFRTHHRYELYCWAGRKPGIADSFMFNFGVDFPIWIQRLNASGRCPYQSIETFLANWTDIKVEGHR